jgi:hypothetical protein
MSIIIIIYQNSFFSKLILILHRIMKQSYLYQIFQKMLNYGIFLYQTSYFRNYIHSNHSFFTPLFTGGIFYRMVTQLFLFVSVFLMWINRLWRGSCSEVLFSQGKEDLTRNYLRYLSTFLFVSLVIYSLINLLWGSGFTRTQMLPLLVVIFLVFGLSQPHGKTSEYLSNSVILRWIQKIYL